MPSRAPRLRCAHQFHRLRPRWRRSRVCRVLKRFVGDLVGEIKRRRRLLPLDEWRPMKVQPFARVQIQTGEWPVRLPLSGSRRVRCPELRCDQAGTRTEPAAARYIQRSSATIPPPAERACRDVAGQTRCSRRQTAPSHRRSCVVLRHSARRASGCVRLQHPAGILIKDVPYRHVSVLK